MFVTAAGASGVEDLRLQQPQKYMMWYVLEEDRQD
jgi:hypothetical protein